VAAGLIVFAIIVAPAVIVSRIYNALYKSSPWVDSVSLLTGKGLPDLEEGLDGSFNTHWGAEGSDREDGF